MVGVVVGKELRDGLPDGLSVRGGEVGKLVGGGRFGGNMSV